ncbi:hypothetical protein VPH35_004342 [Triticum aestivum]
MGRGGTGMGGHVDQDGDGRMAANEAFEEGDMCLIDRQSSSTTRPEPGPGALQRRRLQAAAEGNLQLFKILMGAASALDGGKGRLRDAAEAVKLRGAGALHLATRRGRMPFWQSTNYYHRKWFVDYLNWREILGYTPLAHAIIAGTVDTFQYLLDHGANPDKPDEKGSTPLHLSASGGLSLCVLILFLCVFKFFVCVFWGDVMKLEMDHVICIISKKLFHSYFLRWSNYIHPYHYLWCNFHLQNQVVSMTGWWLGAMKILLDHHADCNKVFNTAYSPLIVALNVGSLKCVKLLIKAGAEVKGVGTVTPLTIAANNGLTDFYKCLLEAGADPDVRNDDDSMNTMNPADLKLEESKANKRNDYATAVKLYSMVISAQFTTLTLAADRCLDDATLYSTRSLCWLKMGEGDQALMDAGICKMKRLGWFRFRQQARSTLKLQAGLKAHPDETLMAAGCKLLTPAEVAAKLPSTANLEAADMVDCMLRLLASYGMVSCTVEEGKDGRLSRRYDAAPMYKFLTPNEDGFSMSALALMSHEPGPSPHGELVS